MNRLVIYKSSAGSGKTYTLVKEYIKLVLRSPGDYKHILAVTFTNKATEEMKTRIIDSLKKLSENENDTLALQLEEEGITFNIKEQAQEVLNRILHDYSSFAVSTIDSFFHRIIRAFAKELNLQLGYDVEMDQETVLSNIIDDLITDIDTNAELREYMEAYVMDYLENERGWNIEHDIKNLGRELFKERYYELRDKFLTSSDHKSTTREFLVKLNVIMNRFEEQMKSYSLAAKYIMDANALSIEDFAYGKSGVANYLVNGLGRTKSYEPKTRVNDALADRTKFYSKASKRKVEIKKAVDEGIYDILDSAVKYFELHKKEYYTASELCKTIYIKGILNDLLEKMKKYRDENNVFLMSDTNIILRSVINEGETPFIYERAGSRYKHFLIDEFQDTSTYQWYNLLPLIVNCLSSGYYAMFVGDVKQSIYRWRGGNMNLLLNEVKESLGGLSTLITEEKLNTNRRSGKEIVEFNNIFFRNAPEAVKAQCGDIDIEIINRTFEDAEQQSINQGGYVNISFINNNPMDEETEEDVYESVKDKAFKRVYEIIKDALADNYSLKDILILVRRNEEASHISSYLFSKNIKVISSESLQLNSSIKVQFLINLLKYLSDSRDNIARTHILFYYLNNIRSEKIDSHIIFTDYLKVKDSLFETILPEEFTGHLTSLRKYSLYEITEELIRIFALNKDPDAYLQRFQDMILEYCGKQNDDIMTFLEWWEENKNKFNVIVPEGEEAVSVLTTHKAKGLERPVVIIPFADWNFFEPAKSLIWAGTKEEPFVEQSPFLIKLTKNIASTYFENDYYNEQARSYIDNLNLLYVSFTRASERLYALVSQEKKGTTGIFIKSILLGDIELNQKLNSDGNFEYGAKHKHVSTKPKQDKEIYRISEYISTDWHKKLIIRSKPEEFFNFKEDKSLNINMIVCEALKRIENITDVDHALSSLHAEGIITNETLPVVERKLNELMTVSSISNLFNPGKGTIVKEILDESGVILKPGRIVINNDTADVVEFGCAEKNKSNMKKYEKALTGMGYKVNKFYIDPETNTRKE